MIRDNYNIIKAKIEAGCTYYGSRYELSVWFDGMNLEETGYIEYLPMYYLKDKGIIKRGYSFKKAQQYLDSEEGKQWLSDYLKDRDYENAKDEVKDEIRMMLWKMNLDQLTKIKGMVSQVQIDYN